MKNKKLAVNPFIIMGMSTTFIVSCIIFSIPLYIGFIFGIISTMIILLKSGYTLKELMKINLESLSEVKNLSLIILLIGATTSIWLASGVVPTIMYYGFTYMQGLNFLLASFLIMVVVSLFMGTAVGTISTVGIALMGIGRGLGIPTELIVGVLVSGAYISDKISPISGLVNLTMTTVNKSYKQLVKGLLPTLIPTIIVTAIIYYIMGLKYTSGDYSKLIYYKDTISKSFDTNIILLILPFIVLFLSGIGVKSTKTISIGLVIGSIFSMFFQHMSFLKVVESIFLGYNGNTVSEELNQMLISGGMISMVEVVFVVVGGVALVRLFEKSGIIMPLIEKLMHGVNSRVKLIFRTGFISSLLTVITCDQAVGIILPGKLLQDKYKEFKLDNIVLARTLSDTGNIIAPLMAWNVNSFIIKSITNISANGYAPYAVLCYLCPVISLTIMYFLYRKEEVKNKADYN